MPSLTTAEIGGCGNLGLGVTWLSGSIPFCQIPSPVHVLEQLFEFFMIEIHPRAGQLQTTGTQGHGDLEDA